MSSRISKLTIPQQTQLLLDLNYLNLQELKTFCKQHSIPYSIWIDTADGHRKTSEDDRKGVILDRVRTFLKTGRVRGPTLFPMEVISSTKAESRRLTKSDQLFYGTYRKDNVQLMTLLKKLTGGKFKNGAIARILAREFWSKGEAPTIEEFAGAWEEANRHHKHPNPEWAYLSDRADQKRTVDWKRMRAAKAQEVLQLLGEIC